MAQNLPLFASLTDLADRRVPVRAADEPVPTVPTGPKRSPVFDFKGFTVTRLPNDRYGVRPPKWEKDWPQVFSGQEAVRGFVYDWLNTGPKDRCEECGAPSKGPLMTREDGYHRVCHECARTKWPQYWAFFRSHGWYPATQAELESNRLDQQSAGKNWDGTPRAPWKPKS